MTTAGGNLNSVLTSEQREHFIKNGWLRVERGVPSENIKRFTDDVWVRLGLDPNDKSTWTKDKIHMPSHREMLTKEFMPKAWRAICEILGGEDRIDTSLFDTCSDALIVNLGDDEWEGKDTIDPKQTGNWHIDGDWFRHFLDSGDQALTIIVLFNDIVPRAGGTLIYPDGIRNVVQWLYDHPEGADKWEKDDQNPNTLHHLRGCLEVLELTGKAGDVFLCHPFMPHSATKNYLRIPRMITNPPITLREPFKLTREDASSFSPAELVIRNALSSLGLNDRNVADWHITRPRRRFRPYTQPGRDALIEQELVRMRDYSARSNGMYVVDSVHKDGIRRYTKLREIEGY